MRDKRAARTLFDELNLPTAKWCAPLSVEDVRNFSSNIEGGVVIKNCRGTGSLDVRLCTGEEDTVDNFLEMSAQPRYLDGDLMLEEFLYGPLVSMEILVVQGQAIVLGVTDRQLGPLPDFCEVSYTFPIVLPDSDIGIMAEAVDALVSRLRISQGFLHVEFIVTNSGPKLVEVNPRLGGGLLAKMMDDCLTVSISELVCTSALDVIDTVPLQNGKASSTTTVYPRRSGRLRSLDGMQRVMNSPFVCEVVEVARIGDEIESAKDYRGAVCQIRATAGSSALAFNSVQTAAQLIVIELME
jgi:biotin carboxylase